MEQNEEFLHYNKNEEKSEIERILTKWMESFFATMFEDVRQERSLIFLLPSTDPDLMKRSNFTDHEIDIL